MVYRVVNYDIGERRSVQDEENGPQQEPDCSRPALLSLGQRLLTIAVTVLVILIRTRQRLSFLGSGIMTIRVYVRVSRMTNTRINVKTPTHYNTIMLNIGHMR